MRPSAGGTAVLLSSMVYSRSERALQMRKQDSKLPSHRLFFFANASAFPFTSAGAGSGAAEVP